ncbi:aquaporin-3-like isoform X3 [Osmerus mordax]|uniref:aquaporin-3-like isoform X3 n=1 Tax=Osmerus mordax TaxID=8014 RepID=UPI00350F675C
MDHRKRKGGAEKTRIKKKKALETDATKCCKLSTFVLKTTNEDDETAALQQQQPQVLFAANREEPGPLPCSSHEPTTPEWAGAHLNPAVTLSLCFLGRHPWFHLPFYVFSQVLGAFLGAATVALQYYDAIMFFGGGKLTVTGPTATAGIFSTYPADYLSLWGGVIDQVIGTAALLVCVLALGDRRNSPAPPGLEPVLVGAVILCIGVSMGSNSGYSLNPARDLGPRLFTYIAGWGGEVFSAGDGWWWVPLVATNIGALVGTLIYELVIEVHHLEPGPSSEPPGLDMNAEGKHVGQSWRANQT